LQYVAKIDRIMVDSRTLIVYFAISSCPGPRFLDIWTHTPTTISSMKPRNSIYHYEIGDGTYERGIAAVVRQYPMLLAASAGDDVEDTHSKLTPDRLDSGQISTPRRLSRLKISTSIHPYTSHIISSIECFDVPTPSPQTTLGRQLYGSAVDSASSSAICFTVAK
jgi:hypothetical protein